MCRVLDSVNDLHVVSNSLQIVPYNFDLKLQKILLGIRMIFYSDIFRCYNLLNSKDSSSNLFHWCFFQVNRSRPCTQFYGVLTKPLRKHNFKITLTVSDFLTFHGNLRGMVRLLYCNLGLLVFSWRFNWNSLDGHGTGRKASRHYRHRQNSRVRP